MQEDQKGLASRLRAYDPDHPAAKWMNETADRLQPVDVVQDLETAEPEKAVSLEQQLEDPLHCTALQPSPLQTRLTRQLIIKATKHTQTNLDMSTPMNALPPQGLARTNYIRHVET